MTSHNPPLLVLIDPPSRRGDLRSSKIEGKSQLHCQSTVNLALYDSYVVTGPFWYFTRRLERSVEAGSCLDPLQTNVFHSQKPKRTDP